MYSYSWLISVDLYLDRGADCLVGTVRLLRLAQLEFVWVFKNFAHLELASTGVVLLALVAADHSRRFGRLVLLQALPNAHF